MILNKKEAKILGKNTNSYPSYHSIEKLFKDYSNANYQTLQTELFNVTEKLFKNISNPNYKQ